MGGVCVGCYNSAVHIHSLRFARFAGPPTEVGAPAGACFKSDGGRATLFFSCEIYYAVVMLWVVERSFKIERSFRRWGAEPPPYPLRSV